MANGIYPMLNVSNLDKSLEFYKGLGFRARTETAAGMTWASVASGNNVLLLFPKDGPTDNPQPADTRAWLSGELGKGVVIHVGVPNARKTYEKATTLRLDVDAPLEESGWGGHGFSVVDPDGYLVMISDKFPKFGKATPRKAAAKRTTRTKKASRGTKKTATRRKK